MNDNENTQNSQGDFFFWLGQDAELVSMSKAEFLEEVKKEEQRIEDYLNVRG